MAKSKRKSMTKKTRFEVFKRDSFKCQYCGRTSPDVILTIDHLHPVAKGGENDLLNLITACEDCNSGKSDRTLDDQSALAKQRAKLEELNERREQLSMMLAWRKSLGSLEDETVDALSNMLSERIGARLTSDGARAHARKLIRKYGLPAVMEAMDTAIEQYIRRGDDGRATQESINTAWSKLGGILRLKDQPEEERQLFYARGILRNRIAYCPDWRALKLLRAAHDAGADVEDLKSLCREARNWTEFCDELCRAWGVSG